MKTLFYFFVIALFISVSSVYAQWASQTLPGDISSTSGIDFINQNHGIMGGWWIDNSQLYHGRAYYTNNGGTNWIEASVPDSMRVMIDVQMINENIGYGSGAYNTLKRNAGRSTNQNQNNNLNPDLKESYEQIGMDFLGFEDYRGYFVETTDGGLSWHPKGTFPDSVYYLVGMKFIDQQTGFVIGSSSMAENMSILKTTDGGNNWKYVYPFEYHIWVEDINFFDSLNGFVVGIDRNELKGLFLRTTDGGESWTKTLFTPLTNIYEITYIDINNILIGGRDPSWVPLVFKSTDAGSTWQQLHSYSNSSYFLTGVDAIQNTGTILVHGTYIVTVGSYYIPFVDISLDGGISWNYSQLPQFSNYIFDKSKMIDQTRWYITGAVYAQAGGFVLFTDNAGGYSDVFEEVTNPKEFSLSQNYPNPFNPVTTIAYYIPVSSHVQLKVYNIIGIEVATLVNEERPPGNYSVLLNASNLSSGVSSKAGYASGVYFYQLQTKGFTQTKKIILIK